MEHLGAAGEKCVYIFIKMIFFYIQILRSSSSSFPSLFKTRAPGERSNVETVKPPYTMQQVACNLLRATCCMSLLHAQHCNNVVCNISSIRGRQSDCALALLCIRALY